MSEVMSTMLSGLLSYLTRHREVTAELVSLAWPALLQGLLLTVVFLTDRILLGHYHVDGLGVMQLCGPALWSLFSLCGSLDVGALALMGRAKGRDDQVQLINTLRSSALLALLMGLLILLISPWITDGIIAWMGRETPELHEVARLYFFPLFLCAPFKLLGGLFFSALQSQSDTKTPMWISGVCGAVNLGLSALFIYGYGPVPSLGIAGAAWGSAIAFTLQAILAGWRLTKLIPGALSIMDCLVDLAASIPALTSALKPVLKVSRGVLGERLGYHGAFLLFTSLVAGLGKVDMSAHQVLLAVESIGFICADAFGVAASALVAQSMGQDDHERAQAVGRLASLTGGALLFTLSIIFVLIPEALISCVTSDPQVIITGVPCLQVAALAQPVMAITSASSGALRGAGETLSPLIASLLGPAALRLFFCWLCAYHLGWGILGIWIGSTIDWLGRAIYLTYAFERGRWRLIRL